MNNMNISQQARSQQASSSLGEIAPQNNALQNITSQLLLIKTIVPALRSILPQQLSPQLSQPLTTLAGSRNALANIEGLHQAPETQSFHRRILREASMQTADAAGFCTDHIEYTIPRGNNDTAECFRPMIFSDFSNINPELSQPTLDQLQDNFKSIVFGKMALKDNVEPESFCTFFRVAPDVLATAGHCFPKSGIEGLELFFDYTNLNGPCKSMHGELIEDHFELGLNSIYDDLALVRITDGAMLDETTYPILKISTRLPSIGEPVYLIGHPAGIPIAFQEAKVSEILYAHASVGESKPIIKINGTTLPGASGGPLIDTNGEVLGLLSNIERSVSDDGSQKLPEEANIFSFSGLLDISPLLASITTNQSAFQYPPTHNLTAITHLPECNFGQLTYTQVQTALHKRETISSNDYIETSPPADASSEAPIPLPTPHLIPNLVANDDSTGDNQPMDANSEALTPTANANEAPQATPASIATNKAASISQSTYALAALSIGFALRF